MKAGPVVCVFCAKGQHRLCAGIFCRCPKRDGPAHGIKEADQ